ncbi:cytochrome P450 [Apiospora arundinis]|uniref:Cytochrome P450 n=1 Tax=Apiospora arundinis TaxID=335852 RepID=A0ABR2JC69_9PEZI
MLRQINHLTEGKVQDEPSPSPPTVEVERGESKINKKKSRGLSVDEILGNTLAINFAGYDTTSLPLSFTLMLLAAHPNGRPGCARRSAKSRRAAAAHPSSRGRRGEATARLPSHSAPGVLALPPGLMVYPMILGVQTDPRYWGNDAEEWRPSRWIAEAKEDGGEEEFLAPPEDGAFIPWAGGTQGCVGKKFAQVEVVAMVACLLSRHGVGVVPGQTRRRKGHVGGRKSAYQRSCFCLLAQ